MKSTDSPIKISEPFAKNGQANVIPATTPTGSNLASFNDGFPPITMLKKTQGGIPPDGKDFNGILKIITELNRWESTGSVAMFDAAFCTTIGGYPKGAMLLGNDYVTLWISAVDDNTNDPNTTPTGWQKLSDEIKNSLGLGTAAYRNVGEATNQIPDISAYQRGGNYQRMPGGFIIHWGVVSVPVNTTTTFNFPSVFTSECVHLSGIRGAPGSNVVFNAQVIDKASFKVQNFQEQGAPENFYYVAMGY